MARARAGWAQIEITPSLGLPMGGRGMRLTPGASVLDPLHAQATVLEDTHGNRTLWISLDLVGVMASLSAPLCVEIAAYAGVSYEAVILNFAHTHSGPMSNYECYPNDQPKPAALQAYEDQLKEKLIQVACDAVQALRPVTVTEHRGTSDMGINRRNRNAAGEMVLAPDPAGTYNRDLWVLDLAADDGRRCVLFSYGCHAVIVYGYAYDSLSADYPGVCRRQLHAELGQEVHCQFIQGLAGNVRPRTLAAVEENQFRKSSPSDLEHTGGQLAEDVLAALGTPGKALDLEIRAVSGWFQARRDLDQVEPLVYWQAMAARDDELSQNTGRYWADRIGEGKPLAHAVPWQVGLIRLSAERTIAWFAGEAVAEWQAHVREWLQDERLVVWGYCQDLPGYLPTDELIPEGGYEVRQSSTYRKTGPGPLAVGVNAHARARFLALQRQLESNR